MLWLKIYEIIMFFPSTFLTVFLCYIILSKSPSAMRRYKYIMLAVALAFYQLDIMYSILLCPTPLPGAFGTQFVGILGGIFHRHGSVLAPIGCLSLTIVFVTIVISFVWREYTVIRFETKPFYLFLHCLYLTFVVVLLYLFVPLYQDIISEEEAVLQHLAKKNSPYDPDYAVWCVIHPDKKEPFQRIILIYIPILAIALLAYVFKAFYRINVYLRTMTAHLSNSTIKMYRSQLISLVLQGVVPLLVLLSAVCGEVLVILILPKIVNLPADETDLIQRDITAIVLSFPSLYSSIHFLIVVLTTPPFRTYVFKKKTKIVSPMVST